MRKLLVAGALAAAGVFMTAGAASAHDLNGGSAQKTCVPGDGVDVTWTFTSSNATGHHIVSVSFNRPVSSSLFTADTVTAMTNESTGASPSLTATAVFEDQYITSFKVDTTIPTDQCPPPETTTVPPTTVVTTVPPTTVPSTTTPTAPPTTICDGSNGQPPTGFPAGTPCPTAPPSSPPPTAPVEATTVQAPPVSMTQAPPTTVCRSDVSADAPLQEGEVPCSLPTTGSGTDKELSIVLILGALASILILAARRRPVEA